MERCQCGPGPVRLCPPSAVDKLTAETDPHAGHDLCATLYSVESDEQHCVIASHIRDSDDSMGLTKVGDHVSPLPSAA